jgi:hypothetical protein
MHRIAALDVERARDALPKRIVRDLKSAAQTTFRRRGWQDRAVT